ncbi:MAG: hypothetical protein ACRDTT_30910, partial [Pseudonocardiaceae bacterium]
MLVIPAPTRGVDTLRVLVTDDPAAAGVPACTPDLAELLHDRWAGAVYAERHGERELELPLRHARE